MDFTARFDEMMRYFSTNGGFLTAKSEEGVNTMTVSWGFLGIMWNKPHMVVVVRPQRYTRKILARANSFTVSIPFGTMEKELSLCGAQSGADVDKSQIVTFKDSKSVDSPVVQGCNAYYECLIRHVDNFNGTRISNDIKGAFYPENDFHDLFFGEIMHCYEG